MNIVFDKFNKAKQDYDNVRLSFFELSKKLREKNDELNIKKKIMEDLCEHIWIRDPPEYQTPTSYTCSICHAEN